MVIRTRPSRLLLRARAAMRRGNAREPLPAADGTAIVAGAPPPLEAQLAGARADAAALASELAALKTRLQARCAAASRVASAYAAVCPSWARK